MPPPPVDRFLPPAMACSLSALAVLLLGSVMVAEGTTHTSIAASVVGAAKGGKSCQAVRKAKTIDVGGAAGWSLGIYAGWTQPPIYVGDSLRFGWRGGGRVVSPSAHNVYMMPSKQAFDACEFNDRFALSNANYTTPPFTTPATYYYGCKKDRHCESGQKVAIVVQKAPLRGSCTPPPPPGGRLVYVGTKPLYWSTNLARWRQPVVRTGDDLAFVFGTNLRAYPYDLWKFANKAAYDRCDFTRAQRLGEVQTPTMLTYTVTEKRSSVIYFATAFTCRQGRMKAKILVS